MKAKLGCIILRYRKLINFYWSKHKQAQIRQTNSCQLVNKRACQINIDVRDSRGTAAVTCC